MPWWSSWTSSHSGGRGVEEARVALQCFNHWWLKASDLDKTDKPLRSARRFRGLQERPLPLQAMALALDNLGSLGPFPESLEPKVQETLWSWYSAHGESKLGNPKYLWIFMDGWAIYTLKKMFKNDWKLDPCPDQLSITPHRQRCSTSCTCRTCLRGTGKVIRKSRRLTAGACTLQIFHCKLSQKNDPWWIISLYIYIHLYLSIYLSIHLSIDPSIHPSYLPT